MSNTDDTSAVPYPRPAYAWYVVCVLLFAYILAFVDREVIAQLVPDIKKSFQLSDTQMSLILGGAFALFYTTCGIFIASLADRGNRRWLIFAGVSLWSVMTCACGVASSYGWLFLARVGVGAGEGALNPPALSLLKDYFPKERIGRAIGLYSAGISSGSGIAFIIGGMVYPVISAAGPQTWPVFGRLEPWQQMFIWVGLPGVLVSLLILTIREPVRRESLQRQAAVPAASVLTVLKFLIRERRSYLVLFVSLSVMAIMNYGVGLWVPAFLQRSYNLDTAGVGHFLQLRGVLMIGVGLISVLASGWLCDVFQRRWQDGYVLVALIGFVFMLIGYVLFPLMPTPTLAILLMIPATIGGAVPTAAGTAALLAIAPANMRAQITAIYYLILNMIGLFVGPTAVAMITNYYFRDEAQIRYSLTIVSAVSMLAGIAGLLYLRPHFRARVEAVAAGH